MIGDCVAIVRGAHAAGPDWMERAGDIVADVFRERVVILDQSRKIDPAVGQRREDRLASGGTASTSAATAALLSLFAGVMRLSRRRRSENLTGKVRPVMARTASCARISTQRRKPCMKRCRSRSWPVKLNLTSGYAAGSAEVSETWPRAIGLSSDGARLATCAPSGLHEVLHCTLRYMSAAARPAGSKNSESTSSDAGEWLPPAAFRASATARKQNGVVGEIFSDARQIGTHSDAVFAKLARRPIPAPSRRPANERLQARQ